MCFTTSSKVYVLWNYFIKMNIIKLACIFNIKLFYSNTHDVLSYHVINLIVHILHHVNYLNIYHKSTKLFMLKTHGPFFLFREEFQIFFFLNKVQYRNYLCIFSKVMLSLWLKNHLKNKRLNPNPTLLNNATCQR